MKGGIVSVDGEVGPTEDTISVLLELLVDPLLPSAFSISKNEAPSSAQEESMAKQVQAVVLLYDYYHRRYNPKLEFLDPVSFCKLAVVLKPSLLSYMKFVRKDEGSEVDDPDKQLSITDKMIMEACELSKSLETSKADVAGLPIAKVAVFLVDSSKECCFLLHSSITQGVWSLIEKEPGPNLCLERTEEEKAGSRKKRITKKPMKEFRNDETVFQQLAFSAVKEISECSQSDLEILESHTVYSISKAKTAVQFYIMQCKQTKEKDKYVPIKDVLGSLQGPLVTKESCGWLTTSVVEYFHLLPYADIISDWFSRQATLEASQEAELEQENGVQPSSDSKGEDNETETEQSRKVTSTSNEITATCKVAHKENIEAGNSITVTMANTTQKAETQQEKIRAVPFTPLLNNKRKLEVENQIKEISPSRILRSAVKLEKMKGADKKVELLETAVYTKREKSVKKDKAGDSSCCQPSKVDVDHSIIPKDSEISLSSLSNNLEMDEPVSSADCSMDGKNKSCSDEHDADEMKTVVLSPTTDVNKEEIVSALQNNHEQNGKNNNGEGQAVPSCQAKVQKEIISTLQSNHKQNGENINIRVKAVSSYRDGTQGKIASTLQSENEQNGENNDAGVKPGSSSQDRVQANPLVSFQPNTRELDKIHKVISLRESSLSQAARKFLHKKRDMLCYQLRSIGDELAICNKNIQTLSNGSEDDLGVILDSVIEGCSLENSSSDVSDQNTHKNLKRKRLCEANLSLLNSCQELDDICHENCWMLPTYNISTTSDGGFQAAITVKGEDFEYSNSGDTRNTPCEARESAASSALTKLRNMASAS